MFLSAYENGYIIKDTLIIPYCAADKRFLPDRYIIGTCPNCSYERARGDQCEKCSKVLDPEELKDPRCSICNGKSIEFREEKHLFLDLPKLQDKLRLWIEKQDHWPDNTVNLALGWLKEGLKQRCITRNLQWGVKIALKEYNHLVHYCWYDAPIAYISITKDGNEAGAIKESWKSYWKDSQIYHFIGKDNIPFHTIIWPAIILSARDSEQRDTNYLLPYFVQGYEYLNWEGEKFSTSQGRGLFSDEALDLFPADYWRFYLLSILPETKDSNFDWNDFQARINNELIANYGNLFYRVTYFMDKYFAGLVPEAQTGEEENRLFARLIETKERVATLVEEVKLREALQEILALASATNKYFQDKKPWEQAEKDSKAAATTLFTAVNVLRALSVLLYPYIPESAERALKALNSGNKKFDELDRIQLTSGEIIKAEILFKKIEKEDIERARNYKSKYAKSEAFRHSAGVTAEYAKTAAHNQDKKAGDIETLETKEGMLPIDEFKKVEMRVGTVLSARDHPAAEKLLILEIDLGGEKRQVVAGLKFRYKPEQLKGQQVIIAANLEPKELRGVQSQGMVLAAEDGTLLRPEKPVKNGSLVM